MRLFFAVELPAEVQRVLGRLRPPDSTPGARDYRWVDPALLHVTLAFLAEQPTSQLAALTRIGTEAARSYAPLQLALSEAGSFGPPRAPRVLWVGLRGDTSHLTRLHGSLATKLREAGFAVEERAFAPHVTLARRRQEARRPLLFPWPPGAALPSPTFTVDALALVHSELSPRGPRYTALEHFRLG